ncbi:MAG: pro-sigmaK processing inhibitor BofA family protein [Oscillospiraceae bacterium]|nr:pro-sigmaK processing inhibitor BofA family protein [Oscillospiraceae bacterium]MBQ7130220.1 pro-sigmaK processing inhibitor BofA family protein [Oscillospiraceae bacterium]
MENIVILSILLLLGIVLVRTLLLPLRLAAKIAVHSGCGFLCLWILNTVSGYTGIFLPINAVTAVIAGFLGLPGIGLIALLEMVA